jgi:hypothetical protein
MRGDRYDAGPRAHPVSGIPSASTVGCRHLRGAKGTLPASTATAGRLLLTAASTSSWSVRCEPHVKGGRCASMAAASASSWRPTLLQSVASGLSGLDGQALRLVYGLSGGCGVVEPDGTLPPHRHSS